jgi:Cys-tRNA synthase (O-phospho-L-seryl-tRNA:Cys-tRNA synthase)
MTIDHPMTLVDSHQHAQSFVTIHQAIASIRQHPHETFQIYALPEVYQTIQEQVLREENREDYASLAVIRKWKGQMSGWSELDDLNEMRDRVGARIAEREKRLCYGGETYSSNGLPRSDQTIP